jgi:O-antigen ligase
VWQAVAFGTFEDPNDLCLIMIISIPLLYAEFRTSPQPLLKGIALLAIPLAGYAAWLTNSRGGYLGIFAMVSAYVIGRTKGFKRSVLLAGSIFFLTTIAPSRFSAGLVGQQDRSILWGDGIAMFKANPFFGVGFYDFQKYSSERKVAHNTYVHVLAETGLVGYLPFFGIIYFAAVHLRQTMNRSKLLTKEDNIQLGGLFSASVGYLTSIYFLSRHKVHISYIIFALMAVKTIGVCESRGLFQEVFIQNAKAYRWWVYCALGSIVVMWVTIRIVNALG